MFRGDLQLSRAARALLRGVRGFGPALATSCNRLTVPVAPASSNDCGAATVAGTIAAHMKAELPQ
jgi:hypothetical protein